MAAAVNHTPLISANTCIRSLVSGGLHAFTAHAFTSISFLSGGVFGVTVPFAQVAINNALDHFIHSNNTCTHVAKFAASFFTSILFGSLVTHLIGAPISFTAGVLLHLGTAGVIIGGCLSIVAVIVSAAVAYLAINAYRQGISFGQSFENSVENIIAHFTENRQQARECIAAVKAIDWLALFKDVQDNGVEGLVKNFQTSVFEDLAKNIGGLHMGLGLGTHSAPAPGIPGAPLGDLADLDPSGHLDTKTFQPTPVLPNSDFGILGGLL